MRIVGQANLTLRSLASHFAADNPLRAVARTVWHRLLTALDSDVQILLAGESTWVRPEWRSLDTEYEKTALESFANAIEPGQTIWDVGSHIGLYTIVGARRTGTAGKVVAWEPAPEAFHVLQYHLKANRLSDRCQSIQEIISDGKSANVTFAIDKGNAPSYSNRIQYDSEISCEKTEILRARSLDEWASLLGAPDLIKMDIEGAEFSALTGARDLLTGKWRRRPHLLLSVHPASIHQYGASCESLAALVQSYGYQAQQLDGTPSSLDRFEEVWLLPLPSRS